MTLNTFLNSTLSAGEESVSLTLVDSGVSFSAWTEVSIDRSLNSLSASFSIAMIDKWRDGRLAYLLKPGVKIALKIGKDPILVGYVDTLDVSVSNDDRAISISGRDVTGDLVDSSAPTTPSEFKNITIESLARKLCAPFLIPVVSQTVPTLPFEKFSVKQGESVFDVLERAAKARGLLLLSRFDGSLAIKKADFKDAPSLSTLEQGVNVTDASATYSSTERFSEYTVRSQAIGTGKLKGKKATEIEGTARDEGLGRTRPKTIIAESSLDVDGCKQRARWEATVRAARSIDANVSVQGWRTTTGQLWNVGEVVNVDIGFIGVQSKKMLISSIRYSKSLSQGTTVSLGLTREDAFESVDALSDILEKDLGWSPSVFRALGF